jgi:hypothetical protein
MVAPEVIVVDGVASTFDHDPPECLRNLVATDIDFGAG